jgi:hypothetical protein
MEAIEATYFDKCDIYRLAKTQQPNGSYKQQRTLIYSSLPCAYSKGSRPAINTITDVLGKETDVANMIMTRDKLYLNPSYIVNQGDEIIITRYGREFTVTAGLPFLYDSHQVLAVEDIRYA